MANPVFVDCIEDQWTKVATNVTSGVLHKVTEKPYEYLQTYRLTGGAAPVLKSDGVLAFIDNRYELISSSVAIDVYIYAITGRGRVRVDV